MLFKTSLCLYRMLHICGPQHYIKLKDCPGVPSYRLVFSLNEVWKQHVPEMDKVIRNVEIVLEGSLPIPLRDGGVCCIVSRGTTELLVKH